MADTADISTKGLDEFSAKFLNPEPGEHLIVQQGQQLSEDALKQYQEERTKAFISRAASFTDDLVAFIVQQKKLRSLTDVETVFGIALANINLRNAYGSPQGKEKLTAHKQQTLLEEFDEVCWSAQQYWDAHV